MQGQNILTIHSGKKKFDIKTENVLYAIMHKNDAEIHVFGGSTYKTRMTFSQIRTAFDDNFITIHRGCIVSAMAVHEIAEKVILNNGEALAYSARRKKEIVAKLHDIQKRYINSFNRSGIPANDDEYKEYYSSFENMPFAFTDIELIFDEKNQGVDWIFRYGNPALAALEKVPLTNLLGHSFGSVFPNMDSKWLRAYERATLYGEKLEIIDYSPEINTYLKVICFPTFKGHCGCILFNIDDIKFTKNSNDAEKALMLYYGDKLTNLYPKE